ncbi:hypothetical protein [Cytobacillus dafuensis]|uniref:Uncharacterized protein n=1 Tax=Cytobacillus dafuensis TaxID=1742359 RepID=A0A5B8Z9J1_CYTDA|nr:hypothetical protein [Cytobacillus dafuensis]QED48953.1 hypothetical protein FSZ17_17715 [Cytobacillus dafuensis]
MNETSKERFIRFVLIGFFMLVTIFAFIYRYDTQLTQKEEQQQPLAIVLKPSVQATDDPIVALYENKNNEHILAIYQIDRSDRFKFRTLHAKKLKSAPTQLSPDRKEIGIWALIDGKWVYFNSSLKEEKRHVQNRSLYSPYETQYEFDKSKSLIKINDNQSISLDAGTSPSVGVHSLSEDGLLWLVLTNVSVKIATIETE